MGREIRNVPKNWEHPKDERNGNYIPLLDEYYGDAIEEWIKNHNLWLEGKHPDQDTDYKFYADYENAPNIENYRTEKWADEEANCFQIYETVSEGAPVSPVFETLTDLENWLVESGHSRKAAQEFCKNRFCFSMIMSGGVMKSNIHSLDM